MTFKIRRERADRCSDLSIFDYLLLRKLHVIVSVRDVIKSPENHLRAACDAPREDGGEYERCYACSRQRDREDIDKHLQGESSRSIVSQLIHKDIKPNNILVTYNGNNIKLIDFGLADQDDYDILKIPAGTKRYLAPEQLVPHAVLDCRTDIYSLGIIIQEMADILKDKKLMAIARRCTQKMPEKRYNTTAEIKEALKKKKKIIPPVYKYSALLIIVIIGGFGLLRNGPFSNRASSSPNTYMPQPSTNVPASHIYQKALLKARIQLQQRLNHYTINEDELKQDSSELSNKLKKYLHEYFPDSTQRETVVYKQILSEIDQDIKREIKQIRQQLR